MQAIYRVLGQLVETSASAAGHWHPEVQHGAAPAALIAWAAERFTTDVPMRVARLSLDLCRPVPVAPLTLRTALVRSGKKSQVANIDLLANGTEVVRATVLRVRVADPPQPDSVALPALDLPPPESSHDIASEDRIKCAFLEGMSAKLASGPESGSGPASMWLRANQAIVEGDPISAVMRAAIAADFCNVVSSPLDLKHWSFIGADMTLSLARPPAGEWILVNAETLLGGDGGGVAMARLADRNGYFGRASQSLVVERR
jgi:hypothetical protein